MLLVNMVLETRFSICYFTARIARFTIVVVFECMFAMVINHLERFVTHVTRVILWSMFVCSVEFHI